jgi:hypothetical protein
VDRLSIQTGQEIGWDLSNIIKKHQKKEGQPVMASLSACTKVLLCSPVSKEEEEEAANGKKGKKGKGKGKEEKRPTTPMRLKDRALYRVGFGR